MPYSNLTSVLDPSTLTAIVDKANDLQTAVEPYSINLTPDEIGKMYKMSINRQSLASRALIIAKDNPTLVSQFLKLDDAKTDYERFNGILSLEIKIQAILEGLQHARMASGAEVMLFVKGFYKSLEGAAEQNVPGASSYYAELQQFYDLPSQPDAGTVVTPVV